MIIGIRCWPFNFHQSTFIASFSFLVIFSPPAFCSPSEAFQQSFVQNRHSSCFLRQHLKFNINLPTWNFKHDEIFVHTPITLITFYYILYELEF